MVIRDSRRGAGVTDTRVAGLGTRDATPTATRHVGPTVPAKWIGTVLFGAVNIDIRYRSVLTSQPSDLTMTVR